jgi:hypothetical protein
MICPGSEEQPDEIHRIGRMPDGRVRATTLCPICGTEQRIVSAGAVEHSTAMIVAHDAPATEDN